MDPEQAAGVPEGRTNAFNAGQSGGLAADSARYNAMVPKTSMPQSVLQSPRPGLNAMSQGDYDSRVLPGGMVLPTANGSSENTYQQSMILRLQGKGL